jgi:pyruvate/2-oxoglutarate dehydrogenase complex dihydrolipoamide acyltransferase (E2) component
MNPLQRALSLVTREYHCLQCGRLTPQAENPEGQASPPWCGSCGTTMAPLDRQQAEQDLSPSATPAAAAHAEATGVDLSTVEGTGQDGKILKSDVEAAAPPEA